jgi:hypothetical protein
VAHDRGLDEVIALNQSAKLLLGYVFTAICLTIIIVFSSNEQSNELTASIKQLEITVNGLSVEFCEVINDMHKIRGFEVLDCDDHTISLRKVGEKRD